MLWKRVLEPHRFNPTSWFRRAAKRVSGQVEWVLQLTMVGSTLLQGRSSSHQHALRRYLLRSARNGIGHANGDVAASGRTPLSTLDEVVGNFAVSSNGKITLSDYFEPYEYVSMDAGDRDLGSAGVMLLDPTTFSGAGISRMAVTIGKNGKA
jgi:hypothetical protein